MENCIDIMIDRLDINDELKDYLYSFNKKISDIKEYNWDFNFNIVIDNMPRKNVEILLEYTTKILLESKLKDNIYIYKEKVNQIDKKNSIIVVKDFDEFYDDMIDGWRASSRTKKFFPIHKQNNNIIIFGCSYNVEEKLRKIDSILFDLDLCIRLTGRISISKEYRLLIEKYKKNKIKYSLSLKEFSKIFYEIRFKDNIGYYTISDYLYDYSIKKLLLLNKKRVTLNIFSEFIKEEIEEPKIEKKQPKLVGLKNIKEEINSLYNYAKFIKKLDIDKNQTYLNMFFLGNPGTGKTTVARLIADKLYELGFLKENEIVEVTPNDLIGKYVGHTKDKTREILKKAEGKLLFIDEAYLLYNPNYNNGNNPFMEEAIVELLKYIEDPKNIVIFAGYTNEMKKIYNANPGIKSRIYKEIIFPDYSINELYKILDNDLKEKGLMIDKTSKKEIINYIKELQNNKDFGNARNIKQLSQQLLINHANRKKDLVITKKDLPKIETKTKRIGFGEYYG